MSRKLIILIVIEIFCSIFISNEKYIGVIAAFDIHFIGSPLCNIVYNQYFIIYSTSALLINTKYKYGFDDETQKTSLNIMYKCIHTINTEVLIAH